MNILRSLVNLGLGAIGAILGNLLAAWVLQDAWSNVITPARLLATVAGFALVILILAWLDARAERQSALTTSGEVRGNVQVGRSVIRVLQGASVLHNVQIGDNVIEVLSTDWAALPSRYQSAEVRHELPLNDAPIMKHDLRQQWAELGLQYQDLTKRIAAVDADLRQTFDGERKLALEQRRAELVTHREQVVTRQRNIESELSR